MKTNEAGILVFGIFRQKIKEACIVVFGTPKQRYKDKGRMHSCIWNP